MEKNTTDTSIVPMRSVTYAMKAEQYLRSRGWRCEVVRNTTRCGYSLKVWGSRSQAESLLREAGIVTSPVPGGGD